MGKVKKYRAKVEVRLKSGYLDPEGESAKKALIDLKYPVGRVSTAKVYEIEFAASGLRKAWMVVEEMCKKLLANPVKDDYSFEVEEIR